MEQTLDRKQMIIDAMKKGVILGIINILIFLLLYLMAPEKLTGFSYLAFSLVLFLSYCIYQSIKFRKSGSGFMSYGIAFQYCFFILLCSGIVNTIFMILFVVIDPSFPEMMTENQLNTSLYWAQKFGAPQDAIDKLEDTFDKATIMKNYSLVGYLKNFGFGVISSAVMAAIIALFTKKKSPEPAF